MNGHGGATFGNKAEMSAGLIETSDTPDVDSLTLMGSDDRVIPGLHSGQSLHDPLCIGNSSGVCQCLPPRGLSFNQPIIHQHQNKERTI